MRALVTVLCFAALILMGCVDSGPRGSRLLRVERFHGNAYDGPGRIETWSLAQGAVLRLYVPDAGQLGRARWLRSWELRS